MKTQDDKAAAVSRTKWEVLKVPAGSNTIQVGAVQAGVGAKLNLTEEQSAGLLKMLPGCVKQIGV
jgi:hypothetical protein